MHKWAAAYWVKFEMLLLVGTVICVHILPVLAGMRIWKTLMKWKFQFTTWSNFHDIRRLFHAEVLKVVLKCGMFIYILNMSVRSVTDGQS